MQKEENFKNVIIKILELLTPAKTNVQEKKRSNNSIQLYGSEVKNIYNVITRQTEY